MYRSQDDTSFNADGGPSQSPDQSTVTDPALSARQPNGQHPATRLSDPAFARLVAQVRRVAIVNQCVTENLGLVGHIKKKVLRQRIKITP